MGLVGIPLAWWLADTDKEGKVYFVQMGLIGPIKIGWAKKVKRRLRGLQSANPFELRLLYECRGSQLDEKQVHLKFDKWRTNGEWFHPDKRIFKYIYNCIFNDEWHRWLKKEEKSFNPPQSRIDYIHEKVEKTIWFRNIQEIKIARQSSNFWRKQWH